MNVKIQFQENGDSMLEFTKGKKGQLRRLFNLTGLSELMYIEKEGTTNGLH